MAWANTGGTYNPYDMDSNGQKLTVRNQNGPDDAAWRTVIAESDVEHPHYLQALRVLGRTELENTNASFQALRVKGKTVCESPSGTRTEPVLVADGKSELQNINTDPDPQHPEYALKVTGRAFFNRGPADNVRAAIVDGQIQLTLDGTNRGKITPNASLNSLDINAGSDSDPNVRIGSGASIQAGNKVFLLGKNISIGGETPQPDVYRVAISGPVNVSGYLRMPWLEADLEMQSPRLEPVNPTGVLDIGTRQGTEVLIGREGHYTIVNGLLSVSGLVEMSNGLLVSGGNIATNGTISSQSDISAQGTISAQGNLSTQGNLSVPQGNATVQGSITAQGNITANGMVNAGSVHAGAVQATGDISCGGAITARNNISTQANIGVGGNVDCEGAVAAAEFLANGPLTVLGDSHFDHPAEFQESVTVHGQTDHESELRMHSQPIIMGGEGENEVKMFSNEGRLDFYIGGELKFYIDKEGGHNA